MHKIASTMLVCIHCVIAKVPSQVVFLFSPSCFRLKLRASDQDKLLVDVNRNLWEVMRTCSDEEVMPALAS